MAESSPNHPGQKAVFLSYAREDTEPARRIADALRGFGLEVWFDQSELRGGDAWDQKIRKQIKDCSLFLAVISAHTQERGEGYFRLEWKLAVERTHLMVAGAPFLVPVAVDETPEAAGMVPDEFLRVQWSRLPQGVPSPQFVEQIRRLLESPRRASGSHPVVASTSAPPARQSGLSRWRWVAAVGVVAAGAALFYLRPSAPPKAIDAVPAATPAGPAASKSDDKSIAVLPFLDMSQTKDQEYFSDGLSEELLNLLAKVHELRVIARTSSFSFKGKEVTIAEVAQKLGVTNVLEGSVRKSGNTVRITAQLIRAADGSHLWSETYDRDLNDIFKVQDEIAAAVVAQLKVALLGGALPARATSGNTEAYTLYLQGKFFMDQGSEEAYRKAADCFGRAIALEPNYAPVWAGLAWATEMQTNNGYLPIASGYSQALSAAEKAVALDPDLVEAWAELAVMQAAYRWDWPAAEVSIRRALRLGPENSAALEQSAWLARTLGQQQRALEMLHKSLDRDPLRGTIHRSLGRTYQQLGRLAEAEAALRKGIEIAPGVVGARAQLAEVLWEQGKLDEALQMATAEPNEVWRLLAQAVVNHRLGRKGESDAALHQLTAKYADDAAYQVAEIHAVRGEIDEAFVWLDRAFTNRDGGMMSLKTDLLLKNLEGDPRLRALRKKMNFPDE